MKKVKLTSKLSLANLNKSTIAQLNNNDMGQVKGGFTYALSTGALCKQSKALGAGNPYECGDAISKSQGGDCTLKRVID
jgi:hypothetical protein